MAQGANDADIVEQLQTQIAKISSALSDAIASCMLGEDSSSVDPVSHLQVGHMIQGTSIGWRLSFLTAGHLYLQEVAKRIVKDVEDCGKIILSLPSMEEIDSVRAQYLNSLPGTFAETSLTNSAMWDEWETTTKRLYKVHAALVDAVLGIRNDEYPGTEPSADCQDE
jgi:hypothetical protein